MYKVVVVEDEKRVRQGIIMGTDWSKINCVVMGEAANGEEGVEMIRKCRPDIVITDIRMPKMMGIEMIENVYEDGLEPYVIFLTAYDDFAYAQQAIKLGVAYGSNTAQVMKLLLAVTNGHENVLKYPTPTVIFNDFGNSTLDFLLRFWVKDYDVVAVLFDCG